MSDLWQSKPVSSALEAELRDKARSRDVVFWVDAHDHYAALADQLIEARASGALPYDVVAFRGSYLELMFALEGIAGGAQPSPLVIYLPKLSDELVRSSPLLELFELKDSVRFKRALDTLITDAAAGRVRPDQIAAFKAHGTTSLAEADAWLRALLEDPQGGGFAMQLRAMQPQAAYDDLLTGSFISAHLRDASDEDTLWERLAAWTGLTRAWRDLTLPVARPSAQDVAFAASSWALAVEYVDDLKQREPYSPTLSGIKALPTGVVATCRAIAQHLRARHPSFYQRTADETEALLRDEVEAARAEDLGKIDTFRFEEHKVLKAALAALEASAWEQAAEWAGRRVGAAGGHASFWLRDDPSRQSAWQLVCDAARLGQAMQRAGARLGVKGCVDDALEAYCTRGAPVDQAHRHLEQRRLTLLYPNLPEFEVLRARLDAMRRSWRQWADAWALDFSATCRAHGFLPAPALQQRALFDEVVRPLTQEPGTTALFLVDALRYEMGEELYRQLEDTAATTVQLKGRLAELPSLTAVGMNALAPVSQHGRLTLSLSSADAPNGFSTGEFRVHDPESRRRAMHDRVGGTTCPLLKLDEVLGRDSASLKRSVAQARLVVVHSQEIDNAGEKGMGPSVFEQVMQQLRAAWRLLRDAGVKRFVFTSDHGFLLLDEHGTPAQAHGRRVDPKRRHVFSPLAADHDGEVRVALSELGYEGASGYVMFPESTAVFDTGRHPMSFVHGGNSLQERVIPVLTLTHRAAAGQSAQRYSLDAKPLDDFMGMHCVKVNIEALAQHALDFGSPKELELALRVCDAEDVSVELCSVRSPEPSGKVRLAGGAVWASVNAPFELFFRLTGPLEARVLVELYHPSASADVIPATPDARFAVTAQRAQPGAIPSGPVAPITPLTRGDSWLEQLPIETRPFFAQLAAHGSVTEAEAMKLLGSARAARKLSDAFEELLKKVPFAARIDTVAGTKRYVREMGS